MDENCWPGFDGSIPTMQSEEKTESEMPTEETKMWEDCLKGHGIAELDTEEKKLFAKKDRKKKFGKKPLKKIMIF